MDYLIEWLEKWNTGIPDIDSQHHVLVEKLNLVFYTLNSKEEYEKLETHLSEFLNSTRLHFLSEEKHMKKYHYPDYSSHKKEHHLLLAELTQLITDVKTKHINVDKATLRSLKNWLISHIMVADKDYSQFYHTQIKPSASEI